MGRTASSSKRKSSKRKSSKLSHEDRKRKKSRRNKPKKHHHHRDDSDSDSDSSFSDKDSISSISNSSYSSEDDYKSKKIRSSKSGRKKSIKSSSSKDSKKRKRSKKDIDTKPSKKSRKVKRKREVSISSESEESEKVRHRGRSRERKISKNKTRISKSRSISISDDSYSRYNSDEEEIIMQNNNNNPMRLKSVITIVEPSERDSYKEEIVYDRDDYPSSRSNDSLDKKFSEEEIDHFNLKETGPIERETEISSTVVGPGNDDLELLLRQKALENLRKFRELKKNSSPVLETGKDGKDGNDPGVNIESIEKDIDQTIIGNSEKGQISNCVEVVTVQGLAETNLVNTENTENTLDDKCDKELKDEVESSLKGVEEEIKDVGSGSSQFEKKTMSVMRGGEMVQVNYKVYIPKKVPALARRQLKR